MSQELLYTSAPEGLNPSDQGFCTVACTQGMPRNLKEVLENLSGYRQADQPPHPVNYSHLIHTIGGKRYQILSRVSDYEKDYSGRTNKLAHHVALTIDELPPSGPSALLNTPLFQTKWDGQTRWFPQGPVLPAASAYHGPCRTWDAVTGDAGWAGILAESAADGSQRPMYVIFSPGQDTLALVREALSMLPREKAWTTSFSTYFTKLPAGVDCLWRFVLEGSPEADQARTASHSRVIDLPELERSRRKAPAGNPYVEAARAGRVVAVEAPTAVPPAAMHSAPSALADSLAAAPVQSAAPASPFALQGTSAGPASPFGKFSNESQKSSKTLFILGGVAAVLFIGVGVLVYSMLTRTIPPPVAVSESEANRRESRARDQKKFISERQKKKEELLAQKAAQPKFVPQIDQTKPKPKPVEKKVDTGPKITEPWDKGLAKIEGKVLEIYPKPRNSGTFFGPPERVLLTQIHVSDPKDVDLTIHSPNGSSKVIADTAQEGFILQPSDEIDAEGPPRRKWLVQRKLVNQLTTTGERQLNVGYFELSENQLTFLREADPPKGSKYQSLQYCLLEIRKENSDRSYKYRLSTPQDVGPKLYDFSGRSQELLLETKSGAVDDPQSLFLDITVSGAGKTIGSEKGLRIGDTARFPMENNVELEFTFQHDKNGDPFLEVKAFSTLRMLLNGKEKGKPDPKRPIGQIKGLVQLRENIDQLLIEEQRININRTDLDRIQKEAKTISEQLGRAKNLQEHQREVQALNKAINQQKDPKEIENLEGKLRKEEKEIKKYTDRMQVVADWITWADQLKPYFEKLGRTTKVNYSIYTMIDGEKIFLARSEADPATDEPAKTRTPMKPNLPENKEPDQDSPKQTDAPKKTVAEQSSPPPH